MGNPFTLSFGKKPEQFIDRSAINERIVSDFTDKRPSNSVYMLTGVRGCGKTVQLSTISSIFAKKKDWIVIELNPKRDMLKSLASQLSNHPALKEFFPTPKINGVSAFGVGVSLEPKRNVPEDIELTIRNLLETAQKHNKRVMIAIDEVSNTSLMREFASSFQILLRKNLPIYMIMTGLYKNIDNLQNQKDLTFLHRTPKFVLGSLNYNKMANAYKEIFKLSNEDALNMAKLTGGYSFAFQVLGYFTWENNKVLDKSVMEKYDSYLAEYAYNKVYSELSPTEKKIIEVYAASPKTPLKTAEVLEKINLDSGNFNTYRDRLIKKGVIIPTEDYGYSVLSLPRFEKYIENKHNLGYISPSIEIIDENAPRKTKKKSIEKDITV